MAQVQPCVGPGREVDCVMVRLYKTRIVWVAGLLALAYLSFYSVRLTKEQEMEPKVNQVMIRFQKRNQRIHKVCGGYRNNHRLEKVSLYKDTRVNRCTNTFFSINSRDFSICNVLKGGSMSWKEFFLYYKIPSTFLADCQKTGSCPDIPDRRLMQVRHPFERILSTWRHIFHSGGWRLLETRFVSDPLVARQSQAEYENITWPQFVRHYVLRSNSSFEHMDDYDAPGVWIRYYGGT